MSTSANALFPRRPPFGVGRPCRLSSAEACRRIKSGVEVAMAGRVEGKVAFITGAARGQGRAHAVRLAQEGADIIAVDICKKIDTVDLIAASTPEDLAETAVEQLGKLDIIVANAGIGNGGQTLDKTSEKDWTAMIDINLGGVWKTVKAGVPHILAGGNGGSIILTSSVGGLKAYPHTGHYVAAKHGVVV